MKFDVVIIGGGLAGMTAATLLQQNGRRCCVVARGLSLSGAERQSFERAGGILLAGDRVTAGRLQDGRVCAVQTEKLGDEWLEARDFLLATGKFFSCGLIADMEHIYEPIFGLDVREIPGFQERAAESFDAPQPFLDFGVRTQEGKALLDGKTVGNLYVAGEVREGISSNRAAIIRSAEEAARLILASQERQEDGPAADARQ